MNQRGGTMSDTPKGKGKGVTTPKNKGIAKPVVKVDSAYTAPKWYVRNGDKCKRIEKKSCSMSTQNRLRTPKSTIPYS